MTRLPGWKMRGSNPGRDKIFFSALERPDRHSGLNQPYIQWEHGFFCGDKVAGV